jgi:MoaA/NifB/PqqE/SkfB family radical SAM enzyme
MEKYNFKLSPLWKFIKFEHNAFHVKRHVSTMLRHLTYKKVFNLCSVELQRRRKVLKVKGYPPFLKIEPTNRCNLKCPNCFAGSGADGRHKGMMDFELYKRLIDEIGQYVIKMNLYFWGEPFLHPQLTDMIRYASEKNIGICTSTNLLVLSEERAEKILNCGLDHLIICIDGVDQKTYETYRQGGSFKTLMNNMEILSRAKKENRRSTTLIEVQFLVFDYNIDLIDQARKLVEPFGFDRFTEKMDAEQKDPYNPDIFSSQVPCYWLYHVPTISWDGTVTPCCDMPPTHFGSLQEQQFMEVWNGEKYVEARRLYRDLDPGQSKSMCAFCHRGPNEKYKQVLARSGFKGPRELFLKKEKPWEV